MRCKLVVDLIYGPDAGQLCGQPAPKGTVIDHPEAYLLVGNGCAIPDDEECTKATNLTGEQLADLQYRYRRIAAGIDLEDYEAYDQGLMTGYHPDGSWVPGPNHADWEWERRKQESSIIIPPE